MFTNYNVDALGWGMTSFGGPVSTALKKVQLRVTSDKECRSYFPIKNSQMCTYSPGRDTCQVFLKKKTRAPIVKLPQVISTVA